MLNISIPCIMVDGDVLKIYHTKKLETSGEGGATAKKRQLETKTTK